MASLEVWGVPQLADGYDAPGCEARGSARSARFQPVGSSLWQVSGALAAGTELAWGSRHGDEALFVLGGEVECDGRRLGPDGVIVVEAGVSATVRAATDAHVRHFASTEATPPEDAPLGRPADSGRGVHTVTADEAATVLPQPFPVGPYYYADGTCPTCRITFFSVDGRGLGAPHRVGSHTHSNDEIVHVLDGELRFGRVAVGEGMSVAVPAHLRYGFRSTGAFRFLNYRADVSTITRAPGSEPILETVDSIRAFVATQ